MYTRVLFIIVVLGCSSSRRERTYNEPPTNTGGAPTILPCGLKDNDPEVCVDCIEATNTASCDFAFFTCQAECPRCDAPEGLEDCVDELTGIGAPEELCAELKKEKEAALEEYAKKVEEWRKEMVIWMLEVGPTRCRTLKPSRSTEASRAWRQSDEPFDSARAFWSGAPMPPWCPTIAEQLKRISMRLRQLRMTRQKTVEVSVGEMNYYFGDKWRTEDDD
jgi:hypothetical protein